MKIRTPFLAALTSLHGAWSQQITNADFLQGKTGWVGDGIVVHISPDGSEESSPGSHPAIRIDLRENQWTGIKQRLLPKAKDSRIDIELQVRADPAFERAETSRKYSAVGFKDKGEYVWSGEIHPKCDFLIRVKDQTWHYRLMSLSPVGAWKTVRAAFPDLGSRQREIALLFPPGKGSAYLKGP